MKLRHLRLRTGHLAAMRSFYEQTIGLPLINCTASSITFQAGATRLEFVEDGAEDADAFYHFAFNIPENKLALGKGWLAPRCPLLRNAETGRDEYFFERWNAHAVYFLDPSGNIVELIARHTLANARPGPFGIDDILGVSEIGLVVPEVPAAVATLGSELGLAPYHGASDQFTAVGDEHGLLIVVKDQRPWFPAAYGRAARVFPTEATLRSDSPKVLTLDPLPYRLAATP